MHEINRNQLVRWGLWALIGVCSEFLVLREGEVDVVLNEDFLEHSALKSQISEDKSFPPSLQLLSIWLDLLANFVYELCDNVLSGLDGNIVSFVLINVRYVYDFDPCVLCLVLWELDRQAKHSEWLIIDRRVAALLADNFMLEETPEEPRNQVGLHRLEKFTGCWPLPMTCDWDRCCYSQFLVQEVLQENQELMSIKLLGSHEEAVELS